MLMVRYQRRKAPVRSGRTVKSSMPEEIMKGALKLRPYFKSKTRGASRTIPFVRRKRKQQVPVSGERAKVTMVTGNTIAPAVLDRRLVRASREQAVFRFRGVKTFDDNGYFWCNNFTWTNSGVRNLPVYAVLLNGANQGTNTLQPMRRLFVNSTGVDDGRLSWWNTTGLLSNGALSQNLESVYSSYPSLNIGQRAFLESVHVKMNLWGSKQKAHRWLIQVVKILDDEVSPFHTATSSFVGTKSQQCYEEMLKEFTYNPLSRLDWRTSKKIKVLKSFERILQPTQTTEVDTDPKVVTLDWYMKWNRIVNFDNVNIDVETSGLRMIDDANLVGNGEPNNSGQAAYSTHPRPKEQIVLLIRASDYTNPTYTLEGDAANNNVHPSFDIEMKSKFLELD